MSHPSHLRRASLQSGRGEHLVNDVDQTGKGTLNLLDIE